MEIREYRKLGDKERTFAAMYGMRSIDPHRGNTPVQFIAGHFAGLNRIGEEEFIRVMRAAGVALLKMGIDCRTPSEIVRVQLQQIQRRDAEII
jgi:hypothetical protein